jgi:hypothetical protein
MKSIRQEHVKEEKKKRIVRNTACMHISLYLFILALETCVQAFLMFYFSFFIYLYYIGNTCTVCYDSPADILRSEWRVVSFLLHDSLVCCFTLVRTLFHTSFHFQTLSTCSFHLTMSMLLFYSVLT